MTRLFVPAAAAGTFENLIVEVELTLPTRLPPELAAPLMMLAEPVRVALSAWKVLPRHTVSGFIQVLPLSVHESGPSLMVWPAASGCIAQVPVVCEVAHRPSMPADAGQAFW